MDDNYLKQQLEWVKYRIKMLDVIEIKLKEMRELAEYASKHDLTADEKGAINDQLKTLQQQVNELDAKSKNFWLEHQ
jgi:flagellin-like hook-associated protein FlgL